MSSYIPLTECLFITFVVKYRIHLPLAVLALLVHQICQVLFYLHHLVEDVVAPLDFLLEGDPGLLQQVRLDIAASQLALRVEVDPDELALNYSEEIRLGFFKQNLVK